MTTEIEKCEVFTGEEIARRAMETPSQKDVDFIRDRLLKLPQVECPLVHGFSNGFYIRTIKMPKGTVVVSKIHKTQHPYSITKGSVSVWIENVGWKLIQSPFSGVTLPGTRRILCIHEDCEWTTFHRTEKTDVDEIEKDVIYNPEIQLTEN